MGIQVRETQATPNPLALKYLLDKQVHDGSASFTSATAATHPLAKKLFDIPGVDRILLLGTFITINKSQKAKWADISRKVRKILSEYDPSGESHPDAG